MWVVLILILGFCLEHLLFAKVLLNVLEVGVLILLLLPTTYLITRLMLWFIGRRDDKGKSHWILYLIVMSLLFLAALTPYRIITWIIVISWFMAFFPALLQGSIR